MPGKAPIKIGTDIITGIRPTRALTLANYIGAVKPIIDIQNSSSDSIMVFVADLHGLTTHELAEIKSFVLEIVADYIALGLDPERVTIFVQSAITPQLAELTLELNRHISVAELLRIPTLKEKIKQGDPETASVALFLYPVLMAADILLQRSKKVPVGKDQLPHIEITRKLARKFNEKYTPIFPIPTYEIEEFPLILSLKGESKMSKTYPEQALFLTDTADELRRKIKGAETAEAGVLSDLVLSHFALVEGIITTDEDKNRLQDLSYKHQDGEKIMGVFKDFFADKVVEFVSNFQKERERILAKSGYLQGIVEAGNEKAKKNAEETLRMMRSAHNRP